MPTLRSLSLTFPGLLIGFAAAAQSAASGPTPTTVLSWAAWWAVGVVLLMAIITAGSAASAAQRQFGARQAEPAATPDARPAEDGVPAAPQVVAGQKKAYA